MDFGDVPPSNDPAAGGVVVVEGFHIEAVLTNAQIRPIAAKCTNVLGIPLLLLFVDLVIRFVEIFDW